MQQVGIKIVTSDLLRAKNKVQEMLDVFGKLSKRAVGGNSFSESRLTSIVKKMDTAVYVVADSVISNLYNNTHQGDIDSLMAGASGQGTPSERSYYRLYERRQEELGLPIAVAYHAGSWRYTESPSAQFRPLINEMQDIKLDLRMALGSEYKTGDTFYVMGVGPALGMIESGQYGPSEGILSPTISSVMSTYKSLLSSAYNKF
jgi:hypothetical protein